jgi:hypothetical protein
MIPAIHYDDLLQSLEYYLARDENSVRLLGIVFARPTSVIAREEIYPELLYFHQRSGTATNFYFAGFYRDPEPPAKAVTVTDPEGGADWVFSVQDFNAFREDVEARTTWKYSGGCDLILTNVFRDEHGKAVPDFGSAVLLNLDSLRQNGTLLTPAMLLERLFRNADEHTGSDPIWGLSDSEVVRAGGSAVKALLLSCLPDGVQSNVRGALQFAVTDLRPGTTLPHRKK